MTLPDGVVRILAPNPSPMTGPGTNSFVVGDSSGTVIIDPGPDIPAHLAALAEAARARGPLTAILITHGHPDHVEGAASLRALTNAPVRAWSREGSPVADDTIGDGERIAAGSLTLTALHTPGHRFDHLCFLLEGARSVFAGDLVAGVGTVVIAPPEGDLLDYLRSLQRLRALDLKQILPAHGPAIEEPDALLGYYLQHRAEREEQVLAAMRAGATTIPAMTDRVYAGLEAALVPAAQLSLEAHLIKLEREGRVAKSDAPNATATWTLIGA